MPLCFLLSCSVKDEKTTSASVFQLACWEVNLGREWLKTKPVPWETPPEMEGPGAAEYNGHARYRTSFVIPLSMQDESLAFYTDGIDDADITYLNGFCIGETGRVPRQDTDGQWQQFRSAPSEPRFYMLPSRYIRYDSDNEITIHVFDYAGTGGFSMKQSPVVGPHRLLLEKYYMMKMALALPRLLVMGFQVVTFILFGRFLLREITPEASHRFVLRMAQAFNPVNYIRKVQTGSSSRPDTGDERIFRYIIFMLVNVLYFFFLFSQLEVKYYFIEDERFWFFMPAVAIYGGFVLIISVFHQEVFGFYGSSRKRPLYYMWRLYGAVTHPFIYTMVIVFLLAGSPVQAWNNFMTTGIAVMCVVLISLFAATAINFFMTYRRFSIQKNGDVFFREAVVRFLFLLATVATVIMHIISPSLFYFQVPLIAVFFSTLCLFVSVKFYFANDILPV